MPFPNLSIRSKLQSSVLQYLHSNIFYMTFLQTILSAILHNEHQVVCFYLMLHISQSLFNIIKLYLSTNPPMTQTSFSFTSDNSSSPSGLKQTTLASLKSSMSVNKRQSDTIDQCLQLYQVRNSSKIGYMLVM
ncbi:hypothetical protein FGO68_gene7873 [Halteria grandinella]|uniref:Uncharacterized protein n=1 Tax=Halteria grandinella TaxID=5974 RepID=A0A8J8SXV0_HALGN|nr:hypothetical protein FGO68_gene7873 [Halteria grandinella]